MSHPIIAILGDPADFLSQIFANLTQDDIDVSSYEMDHICYRVETQESYTQLKQALLEHSQIISEKSIGGRPVAVFELFQPLDYKGRQISIIELPAPKDGSPYPIGFEHVEFAINEDLKTFTQQRPQVSWDMKNIDKQVNADVRVKYPAGSIKFHFHPLKYVINHLD